MESAVRWREGQVEPIRIPRNALEVLAVTGTVQHSVPSPDRAMTADGNDRSPRSHRLGSRLRIARARRPWTRHGQFERRFFASHSRLHGNERLRRIHSRWAR
jgi:hypothetical protein